MRTFFCIPLAPGTREAIGSVAEQIRTATKMRASWVRPENYHVTVRFLGDIDPTLTVDLDEVARRVVSDRPPFEVRLDCLDAFPSIDRARVLWCGGVTPEAYVKLVCEVNRELCGIGFDPERKRPASHVTVARIKGTPDPALGGIVDRLNPLQAQTVRVDRIVLMESRLTPDGAVYAPLFEAPFGGEA